MHGCMHACMHARMQRACSQAGGGGGWLRVYARARPLTLRDGDGLEAVQLLEQAAALGGVQAVDEVARALRRVERLHGLLLGVRAQRPRQGRPPAARLPGPGGGRAGPPAARAPAPEEGQQPRHGARRAEARRGEDDDASVRRRRSARPRLEVLPAGRRGAGQHRLPRALRRSRRASRLLPAPRARAANFLLSSLEADDAPPGLRRGCRPLLPGRASSLGGMSQPPHAALPPPSLVPHALFGRRLPGGPPRPPSAARLGQVPQPSGSRTDGRTELPGRRRRRQP